MKSKHWLPLVRDEDWPSPSVGKFNAMQDRVQSVDAALKPGDQLSCCPNRDVYVSKFPPVFQMHKPAAENNSTVRQEAAHTDRENQSYRRASSMPTPGPLAALR